MSAILNRLAGLVAVLLIAFTLPAAAQQPTRVNPTESAAREQQLLDALKPGAPSAVSGRVSIPDSRARNLIQPAGRDWRSWRDTTLPRIAGVAIVGVLVVLVAFLLIRGRVKVDGGLAGRQILRFGGLERFAHWLVATSFIVLGLSGLNVTFGRQVLLPVVGPDTFTALSQWAKYLHNYMSFAFVLGLVLMFVIWVIHNIPSPRDIVWIAQGGGLIGKKHPPAGKFNAGQKLLFWVVLLGGAGLAVTGYALMFPFYALPLGGVGTFFGFTGTIEGVQTASVLHGAIAVALIALIVAHIYIGTVGMQGAFWAMGSGKVDVNWARQHHSLWADKVVGKDQGAAKPAPAE